MEEDTVEEINQMEQDKSEERCQMIEQYFNEMNQEKIDYGDADDGANELAGQIPIDVLEQIRDSKSKGMFVSGWENDDEDLIPKDMSNPQEQFLTACEEGIIEEVRKQFNLDNSLICSQDSDGYSPLHRAAYNNHIEVVVYLLSKGANPMIRTNDGWTVLHSAACWVNYEVVGILLSHGVDVNAVSYGILTPLHVALDGSKDPEKQYITIKYLLDAPGIDVGIVSKGGDSALQLARRTNERIFNLFKRYNM
uniref:ANK_REP_REGION domain-containing protein n=1 Tax=Rhabditophanes sp. KR3021 TaxID=114890 RepID=A0AC35TV78_9BILA